MATFGRLDDLCVVNILRWLSSTELAEARCTCRRFNALATDDSLWQRLIVIDFGVEVKGVNLQAVYQQLQQSTHTSVVLPFTALVTDQGCDQPLREYWAGNLFSMSTRTSLFCTEARSKNAHVLGVLRPPAHSTQHSSQVQAQGHAATAQGSGPASATPSAPATHTPQATAGSEEHLRAAQHRQLLLRYCAYPAAYLLRPITLAALRLGALPYLSPASLSAARQRLEHCSTKGLEDLFILAYNHMAQGSAWGRSLLKAVTTDEDIHQVHSIAWQVWHGHAPRPERDIKTLDLGVGRQLVDRVALCAWTGTETAASGRRQRSATPWQIGVWSEIQIERHFNVTSPVRCGVVYATSLTPDSVTSCETTVLYTCASEDTPAAPEPWMSQGRRLLDVSNHSWVKVLSDMTTAEQVLLAAAQGSLPPVYGYYCSHVGEWIEFSRSTANTTGSGPSVSPSAMQHPEAGTGVAQGASSAVQGSVPGEGGGGPEGSFGQTLSQQDTGSARLDIPVHPVVWFRYYDHQELSDYRRLKRQEAYSTLQATTQHIVNSIIDKALADVAQLSPRGSESGTATAVSPPGTSGPASRSVSEPGAASSSSTIAASDFQLPGQLATSAGGAAPATVAPAPPAADLTAPAGNANIDNGADSGTDTDVEEPSDAPAQAPVDPSPGPTSTLLQWAAHNDPLVALPPSAAGYLQSPLAVVSKELSRQQASNIKRSGVVTPPALDRRLRRKLLSDPLLVSALQLNKPSEKRMTSSGGLASAPAAVDAPVAAPPPPPTPAADPTQAEQQQQQQDPQSTPASSHAADVAGSSSGSGCTQAHSPLASPASTVVSSPVRSPRTPMYGLSPTPRCPLPTSTLLSLCGLLHELSEGAATDCEQLGLWVNPHSQADSPHSCSGAVGPVAGAAAGQAAARVQRLGQGRSSQAGSSTDEDRADAEDDSEAGCPSFVSKSSKIAGWDWPRVQAAILHSTDAISRSSSGGTAGGAAGPGSSCGGAGRVSQTGAVSGVPAPVPVTRGMWESPGPSFPFSHALPSAAPEVSSVFGWGPGTTHCNTTLHIRLHQSWASTGVLVKLTAAEDLRPTYNQGRGGCNIDAAYCCVLGSVATLPGTCHLDLP